MALMLWTCPGPGHSDGAAACHPGTVAMAMATPVRNRHPRATLGSRSSLQFLAAHRHPRGLPLQVRVRFARHLPLGRLQREVRFRPLVVFLTCPWSCRNENCWKHSSTVRQSESYVQRLL